jgi:hypothetical protein
MVLTRFAMRAKGADPHHRLVRRMSIRSARRSGRTSSPMTTRPAYGVSAASWARTSSRPGPPSACLRFTLLVPPRLPLVVVLIEPHDGRRGEQTLPARTEGTHPLPKAARAAVSAGKISGGTNTCHTRLRSAARSCTASPRAATVAGACFALCNRPTSQPSPSTSGRGGRWGGGRRKPATGGAVRLLSARA